MTPVIAPAITQGYHSKLSELASSAMAQVKTIVPQMAASALRGYLLSSLIGLTIQENMSSKEMALYFALLPVIDKVIEPIFKRLISEQGCKDAKQLAARTSIQKCLSRMFSPIPAAAGYNLIATALGSNPLAYGKALFSPLLFIQSQIFLTGAIHIRDSALKTLNDAYDLDIPQDPHAYASGSEAASFQPPSAFPDKALSRLELMRA